MEDILSEAREEFAGDRFAMGKRWATGTQNAAFSSPPAI